jgi:hypothetical protein
MNSFHTTYDGTYRWLHSRDSPLTLRMPALPSPFRKPSIELTAEGACRVLRVHCVRWGVSQRKSRPMDTDDATYRYLSPKAAKDTSPHSIGVPRLKERETAS